MPTHQERKAALAAKKIVVAAKTSRHAKLDEIHNSDFLLADKDELKRAEKL